MLCKVYVRANSGWEGWQNATMMVGKAGDGFLFEPLLHPHQVICGLLWVLGGKQWYLHHQAADLILVVTFHIHFSGIPCNRTFSELLIKLALLTHTYVTFEFDIFIAN